LHKSIKNAGSEKNPRKEAEKMTLLEALEDIGKGRIIDNGCDYELIALAKGRYIFVIGWIDEILVIDLDGKPGENARKIERTFDEYCEKNHKLYNCIHHAEYKKL
jgi:hypothetical protein